MRPLTRLKLQLTAWYAGTFSVILFVFGVALFTVITKIMHRESEESLHKAVIAIRGAAAIRLSEREVASPTHVVDALTELNIPERSLYLFDATGHMIVPDTANPAVRAVALDAAQAGRADQHFKTHHDSGDERLYEALGERFTLADGRPYVAVAVADRVEIEDAYASLIATFAAAAVAAIVAISGVGWFLARKSIEPIERNMALLRQFVADAAHELRTPVSVLRSRADVALQRERDPAAYVDALTAVGLESERMGRIVNDLLILARADAGERAIATTRLYVDDIALDAVASVRVLAEQRGVDLDVLQFEESAAVADAGLVRQLLVILLDNAVKFTAPGGRVSLSVQPEAGRATVVVADNGVGIAAAELPRVFDRFYRGDDARRRADGAGLGLSIARWIADVHDAELTVDSVLGEGTRVTVRFPAP
ncbi:MAG TPA: HAMP domain-containing sensor histidine kinase [Gemmatimonadaceae bacterium]|nr:HAMP domain-containing sensor histidine kinase [Gemmatimonadaceae bacterium]